jgi:hypothetical protein
VFALDAGLEDDAGEIDPDEGNWIASMSIVKPGDASVLEDVDSFEPPPAAELPGLLLMPLLLGDEATAAASVLSSSSLSA